MSLSIPVYRAGNPSELSSAAQVLERALSAYAAAPPPRSERATLALQRRERDEQSDSVFNGPIAIPPSPELIGIDLAVYRQIADVLNAGKRHLMFYGPPGTGKTSLASYIATFLYGGEPKLVTGSADWSSQDIIGGYQPIGGGLRFVPGVLLEHFDKPLIIDELNRCDIDKVLGPLFTVLSGQSTTLPYLTDPDSPTSERYVILPTEKRDALTHEFSPTRNWRLLATINSIDKASLYQMSYALTRRFAWILVDVPEDLPRFIIEYCGREGWGTPTAESSTEVPLANAWKAVNRVRRMGAAPFVDVMRMCRQSDLQFNFFTQTTEAAQSIYVMALATFVVPMLDGILRNDAQSLAGEIVDAFGIAATSATGRQLSVRLLDGAI